MLIASKYKDYYDGVVGTTGVDKTIVFERTLKKIDNWKEFPKPFCKSSAWNYKNKLLQFFSYDSKSEKYEFANHFIIGFCGKLYLGFMMHYYKTMHDKAVGNLSADITYDIETFKSHFNQRWSFADFDEYVEYVKNYDCIDIHRELNTPIFLLDMEIRSNEKFIVNPVLKEYEFYKVFDSFMAFQEIQMFIGGVLGVGENPTVEVSDKDKIISRGFDYKWSFRKKPKEKK